MKTWIALLRAVNLAGKNRVAMAALRDMFEAAGYADVRTLLQSGNVVFKSAGGTGARLEKALEAATKKRLGMDVEYMVRSADEWEKLVAVLPLVAEAKRDPGHLVVMCMKGTPKAKDVAALQASVSEKGGPEIVRARGTQLYIFYPAGIGTTKLTVARIEKAVGVRGTGRNWNTTLKLLAMVRE